jgi:predicted kinase
MDDSPGPILVVSGSSGVGKTTVSAAIGRALGDSVHVRVDDFMHMVVSDEVVWTDERQNHVLGGAALAAALACAEGGYTVLFDGHILPAVLPAMSEWAARRGVPLHYAVLRADLDTCRARVDARDLNFPIDATAFADVHARFADLGDREANVIDATGPTGEVTAAVLGAFRADRLRV